jgi:hypothetical protein
MTERESLIIKALVRGFRQILASLEAISQSSDSSGAQGMKPAFKRDSLADMDKRRPGKQY